MAKTIAVTENHLEQAQIDLILNTAAKYGYEVAFYDSPKAASGHVDDVEIIYGGGTAPLIPEAPALKWICCSWAGVDPYIKPGVMPDEMILTNASGTCGLTISEHVIMVALMMIRHMPVYMDGIKAKEWRGVMEHGTLKDSRITLLGAGDIGRCCAAKFRAFEPAKITAVSRTGKTEAACFDAIYPQSQLNEVLPGTDILVMSLPSTPETQNVLNAERIALLPKTAFVINVGRGSAIDEDALAAALNEERIAGAALDVFKEEPLPVDHPLWTAKNTIVTPHVAGNMTAPYTRNKNASMFCEDLVNYCEGRPMTYLVNRRLGY